MGCGRVGAALAIELDTAGFDVVVIDRDPESFDRLPGGFAGRTVTGAGFDRVVLEKAGIRDATAFAAVSSGDNSNIIAARVARETFGIERVIARIYDAGRAAVYERRPFPGRPPAWSATSPRDRARSCGGIRPIPCRWWPLTHLRRGSESPSTPWRTRPVAGRWPSPGSASVDCRPRGSWSRPTTSSIWPFPPPPWRDWTTS